MFNGYKEITDRSESTGFEQYLLLDYDNGYRVEAYGFDDNTPMDIETMVAEVFKNELDVEFSPSMAGPNHAAIITDGRNPDSVVVWTSTDFYFV